MGLFDSYPDPQTGGSLIDRLLAQYGTQSLYQPSQGFAMAPGPGFAGQPLSQIMGSMAPIAGGQQPDARPLNPTEQQMMSLLSRPGYQPGLPDAAAPSQPAPAPERAPPLAIGGYQMPRAGSPDLYQPQQVETPPAAQPTQGQMQAPPAVQAAFMQPPTQSGFGGAARGALANLHNGPLGLIAGALAGGLGMGQGSPQEQARAQLNAQYQALMAAGLSPQKAYLATINPEFAKTIIPQTFGADKNRVVKVGQNGLGVEQYKVFNPAEGTFKDIPKGAGDAADSGGGLGNMDLTGKAYLASLPKSEANIVQQMVEGTIAPPSSFALAKPMWVNRLAAAKNYDPTFDATNWSGRVAGIKDFSAGKSSEMVRSANQTLHHVGQLLTSMDDLNNNSYPALNWLGNKAAEATGSGAQDSFRTNAHAVAEELSKVFKGSNLSDAEIHAWEQNLHENMSPEQQRTQVAKLRDLLKGSLEALEEKRQNSIGPIAAEKQGPLIKDEGQRVLKRIDQWTRQGAGAAQGAAPATTKTGVSWSVVQ